MFKTTLIHFVYLSYFTIKIKEIKNRYKENETREKKIRLVHSPSKTSDER